jgi:intraflagellar transport protein 52
MLGLQPATFPPILREPPNPSLELFDLDDEFASEKVKLAYLTNKCNNEDLDYYLKEVGDILGFIVFIFRD